MSIRNIVLWSASSNEEFVAQYLSQHVPLARSLPGIEHITVSQARSRKLSLMAELHFASLEDLKGAFASPAGEALLAHTRQLEQIFELTATSVVVLEPLEA